MAAHPGDRKARGKRRSSSFAEIFSRILPSNREERGHTSRSRSPERAPIAIGEPSQPKLNLTRKEQRRSLKESGDFLGVQGANPRTGYWDPSGSTSTSQLTEGTKKRLEDESREVDEKRRALELARLKHQADLKIVQMARDAKRAEKDGKKKADESLRKRRLGRWKPDGNGWSSVLEPNLSPIVQSVAGSPFREMAPEDRLFPMPSANNPTPYVYSSKLVPQDYFGLGNMLLPPERPKTTSPEKSSRFRTATMPSKSSASIPEPAKAPETPSMSRPLSLSRSIPRKPVGSPPKAHQRTGSTGTIIHSISPTKTFLWKKERRRLPSSTEFRKSEEAIVSSSQLLSTNVVETHHPLVAPSPQKPQTTLLSFLQIRKSRSSLNCPDLNVSRNVIRCQEELPLASGELANWNKTDLPHSSSIDIHTTTTTGYLPRVISQLDGTTEDQATRPSRSFHIDGRQSCIQSAARVEREKVALDSQLEPDAEGIEDRLKSTREAGNEQGSRDRREDVVYFIVGASLLTTAGLVVYVIINLSWSILWFLTV